MSFLSAERYRNRYEYTFDTSPVRLNIDDVNEIVAKLAELGWGDPLVLGNDANEDTLARPIGDLGAVARADVVRLHIQASTTVVTGTGERHLQVWMNVTPNGTSFAYTSGPPSLPETEKLQAVAADIRRMADRFQLEAIAPKWIGIGADALIWLVALGLGGWAAWSLHSVPAAVFFLGVIVYALRKDRARRRAVETWITRRPGRHWLVQKSRKELATERANRHANWRIGLPIAALAAIAGALVAWLLPKA